MMENSKQFKKFVIFLKKMLLITTVACVLTTFTGCYFFPKEAEVLAPPLKEPEKVTYSTAEVKQGTIEKQASCIAFFVSAKQVALSFKSRGGYLKAVYVNTGDTVQTNHNSKSIAGEMDDDKKDVSVKQGDVLAELDTDSLGYDIKQQKIVLNKAELAYERVKAENSQDKYALELAELDVESARLRLEDMKSELQKSKLICPVSGVIDYVDETQVGEYINANKTFIRIIDPTQLLLESNGDNAAKFRFGMKVEVNINGQHYPGEVVMSPYDVSIKDYEKAVNSGKTAQYNQLMDTLQNTIRIKVPNLKEKVAIGDSAAVSVSLLKKDNVLMVPKKTIHDFQDKKYVKVLRDGIISEQYIEVGIESDTDSEVVKGLEKGDKILLN